MARPNIPEDQRAIKQCITVKPDVLPVLMKYCQDDDRTMSWVIDKALREWLPNHGYEIPKK